MSGDAGCQAVLAGLVKKGHNVTERSPMSTINSIRVSSGCASAADRDRDRDRGHGGHHDSHQTKRCVEAVADGRRDGGVAGV